MYNIKKKNITNSYRKASLNPNEKLAQDEWARPWTTEALPWDRQRTEPRDDPLTAAAE